MPLDYYHHKICHHQCIYSNDRFVLYFVLYVHLISYISHFWSVCMCSDIEFKQGDVEHLVEVEVLFDGFREMREAFTLHLKPDENMVAETQVSNVFVPNHRTTITLNPT